MSRYRDETRAVELQTELNEIKLRSWARCEATTHLDHAIKMRDTLTMAIEERQEFLAALERGVEWGSE